MELQRLQHRADFVVAVGQQAEHAQVEIDLRVRAQGDRPAAAMPRQEPRRGEAARRSQFAEGDGGGIGRHRDGEGLGRQVDVHRHLRQRRRQIRFRRQAAPAAPVRCGRGRRRGRRSPRARPRYSAATTTPPRREHAGLPGLDRLPARRQNRGRWRPSRARQPKSRSRKLGGAERQPGDRVEDVGHRRVTQHLFVAREQQRRRGAVGREQQRRRAERGQRLEPQRGRGGESADQAGPDAVGADTARQGDLGGCGAQRPAVPGGRRVRLDGRGIGARRAGRSGRRSRRTGGSQRREHDRTERAQRTRRAAREASDYALHVRAIPHRGRWRSCRSRRSIAARSTSRPSPASASSSADAASGRLPSAASTSA